ncbi:hypothetical protein J2S43_007225 [Catenuloplanes nepalensis]|uniref:Uncharacterized protein n=1 Tax=Catenuloplanes nepalensis TaxID=587533 RepID=A0ABT9N4T6_9ACTN|nr:DUF6114 domain-containing protein [Catenuloplanes nepalensis]MDP9798713.1 hypothetical protein [Catenuloplanes nepalensis]
MRDVGGAIARTWRAFGHWRWNRPFWGGLLLILAGLEMFGSTQGGGINGLSVHVGPSGYLSWLIPGVLVTAGLLVWFTPAQRVFYAVIGALTSVFSLMAVNLGGFFAGLVLGALGSILAFGWTPPEPIQKQDQEPPPGYDESTVIRPASTAEEDPPERRTLGMSVWILILALVSAVGVLPGAEAARAAPCPPEPTASPSPSASAGRSPGPIEGWIGDITDGLGDLLGLDGKRAAPTPTPSAPDGGEKPDCGDPGPGDPAPSPGNPSPSSPSAGDPGGGDPGSGDPGSGDPGSGGPGGGSDKPADQQEDAKDQVKRLGTPAGVPPVAMRPSLLTGTKVEMWNLGMDGIVDMPRADGSTIKALQFSMTKAYTHDFRLETPRHQELSPITSSKLGVEGDVRFYATKFTGTLLGITITLTPESPIPPDGIPIALPYIAFQNPSMELLLATCDTLTGPDLVDVV